MPHAAAGMRIDPPVSVPSVASAMPAATLTADPPLDPPGDRVGSCGLRAGPERRVLVRGAERELVQVRLADDDGAGLAQLRDRRRVATGDVALAHARRRSRRRAPDVEEILDRHRHAVQRTAVVSGRQLAVRLARLPPRLVRHDEDERVQARVVGLDAPQALLGDLLRRHFRARAAAGRTLDGHACRRCSPPVTRPMRR